MKRVIGFKKHFGVSPTYYDDGLDMKDTAGDVQSASVTWWEKV